MLPTDYLPESLCGRPFGQQGLAAAIEELHHPPAPNRAELARRLCRRLNWHNAAGKPRLMSARVALLELHRRGLLELPPPLKTNGNGRRHPLPTPAGEERSPICASAGRLAPLCFERIEGRGAPSRLWNEFMERYHYLGYAPAAGAQLRYFVHGRDGQLLALLGFGAAARALADRDRLIGWDPRQKQARLCQVINNGRFLILPWVRSPNLASMVLGACVRHVRADFARCHGIRLLLLESFVERGRFRGSCYKAANWLHAGVTRGRGRNDRLRQADLPAKDIWLYPLEADSLLQLRAPLAAAPSGGNQRYQTHGRQHQT